MIKVFDNVLEKDETKIFEKWLLEQPFKFNEKTDKPIYHWSSNLSISSHSLLKKAYRIVNDQTGKLSSLSLERVYCNAHTFDNIPSPHIDSNLKNALTMLLYGNHIWKPEWAGETVFFKDGEIFKSVLPKPGRVVLFNSNILHCARVPTRLFFGQRFTVAYKFV